MKDYEILNDFIDGELPPEQEPELFAALNASEELRSLMKRTIALNNAAKSPALTSQPTAEATKSLFGKLGISVSPETPLAIQPAEVKDKRRYLPMIATVAAVFLAMLALTINMKNSNGAISQAGSVASNSIKSGFPVITSTELEGNSLSPKDTIVKYVYVQKESSSPTEQRNNSLMAPLAESSVSIGRIAGLFGFPHIMALPNNSNTMALIPFNPPLIKRNEPIQIDTNSLQLAEKENSAAGDNQIGLTVEFRGSHNWLYPEPNIEPMETALFKNNSIALMYSLTEELALGAEVRQDNFFQKYQGYDRLMATETIYEQQPNFTSGGIFARYSLQGLGFEIGRAHV